jgi:hypothetical protein
MKHIHTCVSEDALQSVNYIHLTKKRIARQTSEFYYLTFILLFKLFEHLFLQMHVKIRYQTMFSNVRNSFLCVVNSKIYLKGKSRSKVTPIVKYIGVLSSSYDILKMYIFSICRMFETMVIRK